MHDPATKRPGSVNAAASILYFMGIVTASFNLFALAGYAITNSPQTGTTFGDRVTYSSEDRTLIAISAGLGALFIVLATLILRRSRAGRLVAIWLIPLALVYTVLSGTSGSVIAIALALVAAGLLAFHRGAREWFKR